MWVSKREYKLIESELDHYRQRSLSLERENARLHDALLLTNSISPVSDTVRVETQKQYDAEAEEMKKRQAEMSEIFGTAMGSMGVDVPDDLKAEIEAWQTR